MIVLARQKSETQKIYEALIRRLPSTHAEFTYYSERLRRIQAGYAGEQRVDAEWLEMNLPHPHYFLHDLQVINRFGTSHQMDTIFLCPHFILILEIKNITGYLEFDEAFAQFTRTNAEGIVEGMLDPLHQVKRHVEWMKGMIQQERLDILVKYAVIFATKNAILSQSLRGQPVFHVSGLRNQVKAWLQQHNEVFMDEAALQRFANLLFTMHTPMKRQLTLPIQDIVKGVLCPRCSDGQKMSYRYKKWFCERCGLVDNQEIFTTLDDYRLLINGWLTNKSFCEFFAISSPNVAYRILQQLPLKALGTKRHRRYWIAE
ncbi:nuclease-related domain-containing protein [Lysinibacillus sp. UGB7]|uniref:nuclease-related domain-containing protein n=1 Tax=Lysinibacillus sp. UGB7 TaxID=3411039 RepID=UPI003B7E9FEA